MDHIEKWLVEQAHQWHPHSLQEFALLMTATRWHDEGPAVLKRQRDWEVDLSRPVTLDQLEPVQEWQDNINEGEEK